MVSIPLEQRFWASVEKSDNCWLWLGCSNSYGTGTIWLDGRPQLAPRVAYELLIGPIPAKAQVHHTCENNACVRPEHLELRRPGKPSKSLAERFWPKVNKTDTCWLWTGAVLKGDNRGYGVISVADGPRREDRKTTGAHRVAYELVRGPIPDDLELDHLCRNKLCVNPDHLEPVTHSVNMQRASEQIKDGIKRGIDKPCEKC